jgi:hypothetical protein
MLGFPTGIAGLLLILFDLSDLGLRIVKATKFFVFSSKGCYHFFHKLRASGSNNSGDFE